MMNCPHLIDMVPGGVRCRKNGGPETTCSHGVCLRCSDGGGPRAAWKVAAMPLIIAAIPTPPPAPRPPGVGDHLHDILIERFGARPDRDCGCGDMIARMNAWGPDGCREHRGEIIDTLMEGKARLSIWLRAAVSVAAPLARVVCGDMLDEAIRRCEADHIAGASKVIGEGAR